MIASLFRRGLIPFILGQLLYINISYSSSPNSGPVCLGSTSYTLIHDPLVQFPKANNEDIGKFLVQGLYGHVLDQNFYRPMGKAILKAEKQLAKIASGQVFDLKRTREIMDEIAKVRGNIARAKGHPYQAYYGLRLPETEEQLLEFARITKEKDFSWYDGMVDFLDQPGTAFSRHGAYYDQALKFMNRKKVGAVEIDGVIYKLSYVQR